MAAPRAVQRGQTPVSNALRVWASAERDRINQRALENVQQTATRTQRALNILGGVAGAPTLASAPEDTTGVFAEAFEAQARAVFSADLAVDARRTLNKLSREYAMDPEGFGLAYNAYMQGQLKPLVEQDATAGEEVRLRLEDMGLTAQQGIIERAAGQAQANERAALSSSLQQFEAELQDGQLNDPDFATLQEGLADYEAQIMQAQQSGLVSVDYAVSKVNAMRANGTREYARGRFQQAVQAGDVGAARGVIETLRTGGLFEDNEDGRRLAASLTRELEASLQDAEAVSSEQLSIWNRTLGTAERLGTPLSNPEVQAAAEGMRLFGNPAQQDAAMRYMAGAQIEQEYGQRLRHMSTAEVEQELAMLRTNPQAFSEERAGALQSKLEARRDAILEAQASGNPLNAVPNLLLTTPAIERQQARVREHRAQGVPLDEVPHVTDSMVRQAGEELSQARRIGDATRAVEVIDQLSATAQDPHERMTVALQSGMPEVAAFVTMAALAPDTAETLFNLAFQGSTANDAARSRAFDAASGMEDEIFRAAELASMGRTAVRDELEVELQNAFVALANEFEARGETGGVFSNPLKREFMSLLEPFLQETELVNGRRLPAAMLTDVEVNQLNTALTDEAGERFGDALLGDDATRGSIVPAPLPDGQWGFQDSRRGAFIHNTEGDIIKLDARPAVERAIDEQMLQESSFLGRLIGGRTPVQQALEIDIPRAAESGYGDVELLTAVFKAGMKMPPSEKLDNEWTMVWARENAQSIDMDAYRGAWRQSIGIGRHGGAPARSGP
jgi:hypothetical protein